MIKFSRLLFFHIFIYFRKKEGKSIAKFSTFAVFTVMLSCLIINIYNFLYQRYDINYTSLSGEPYILACLVIGVFLAYYLNKKSFKDFDEYYDYSRKYYIYFFILLTSALFLVIYTGKISRKRLESVDVITIVNKI
ncbi:MAG: hypothetical protein K0R36_2221 [Chryseobacterium sp.]|jgi:uncharacterized membrane protein YiaA|nr:hypothetical protein [Chryseobacterium sp.]